jgi:hypothetical protein
MSLTLPDCPKFTVSRTGLAVHTKLSFEEWAALAPRLNEASRCIAFLIGDWLIYGEAHFAKPGKQPARRVGSAAYERAMAATGLDRSTLITYAYVARRVSASLRNEDLSWEHHKAVAKLEARDQTRWLKTALNGDKSGVVSTRRLRKSITAGHLLGLADMRIAPGERGRPNHIPFVNRLCAWWETLQQDRWLTRATPAQRAALKRDLLPLMQIYERL